ADEQFPGGMIDKAIWLEFFGRKTPCLHGPESYARFNRLPTVFFDVRRVKRGFYELEIKPMFDDPVSLEPETITKTYMALLEERIRKYPADWLWSHKRWKHEK
ncbi:MAG: lysophospholipid acyltransferase family protein, partial [Salinivirgaceae bacterium]